MSEFRQYRLASQLLDRFSCLRDPKSYSSNLFTKDDAVINFLLIFPYPLFIRNI